MNKRVHTEVVVKGKNGEILERQEFDAADDVSAVLGDGQAEIAMGISEKIGGPGYSSVSLYVNVKLRCGQTDAHIRAAQELAMREVVIAMDTHFDTAVGVLKKALRDHENFA